MKKITSFYLIAALLFITLLSGCGKAETELVEEAAPFTGTIRVLNIKSEVDQQIKDLAAEGIEYLKEIRKGPFA